ncbi:hypothetical protein [Alkalihalobacillus deserti]|uniref:hypothetical protein n=1 Tax=Alkalihalobacillus deserti TaxID=2879466 RepID=UPI001D1536E8|nr:hypothetical protein [Alkalihalobacillus deserti]
MKIDREDIDQIEPEELLIAIKNGFKLKKLPNEVEQLKGFPETLEYIYWKLFDPTNENESLLMGVTPLATAFIAYLVFRVPLAECLFS